MRSLCPILIGRGTDDGIVDEVRREDRRGSKAISPDCVRNMESGVSQDAKATTTLGGLWLELWSDVIMGISQTTTVLVARYSAHFCLQRAENSDG